MTTSVLWWMIIRNVLIALVASILVSASHKTLSTKSVISSSQIFRMWKLINLDFLLSRLVLLLNLTVFTKPCNKQKIMSKWKLSVFFKSYSMMRRLLKILSLRLCLRYLMQCLWNTDNNLILHSLLKTSKHPYAVLEVLFGFPSWLWDIIFFSFHKIVSCFTNSFLV